jgi:hypothetical protein
VSCTWEASLNPLRHAGGQELRENYRDERIMRLRITGELT